jgi:glucose-1-phosphate adenylyltransferase
VEYAIIGENCVVEAGARVGTAPDGTEGWGVATCGPNVRIAPGHTVPAASMIYPGEEV